MSLGREVEASDFDAQRGGLNTLTSRGDERRCLSSAGLGIVLWSCLVLRG